jgi:predicted thioesterase
VTEQMTAIALGSGDVPVLGTPAVLALLEEACVAAVASSLPAASTSVGTWTSLDHLKPSRVGATVTASAVLESVDGKALTFAAEAHDGDALIARASLRRVIVDRERFR